MTLRHGSVDAAAVVAFHEPIAASVQTIFLEEATIAPAKCCTPVTLQKFEVQPDQARIFEVGRKVVTGARWLIFTHVDDGIPNLWRQMFDSLRIRRIVADNLTTASECDWLIAK
jgi:hypothetical protein